MLIEGSQNNNDNNLNIVVTGEDRITMGLSEQRMIKGLQNNNDNNLDIVVTGEDRISKLPDELLHHILFFLPIRCAVRTSILSKRWRNVLVFSPILDFSDWRFGTMGSEWLVTERFINFVDRILNFDDNNMPSIQKFYLKCDEYFWDVSPVIHEWISLLIRRKVEELYLSVSTKESFVTLPNCLFTYESLTKLDLEHNNYLWLPTSISLPRLKFLQLREFIFMDDNLTQQFFSNCPVLEVLILAECSWENMEVISISAPLLKYLSFDCNQHVNCSSIKIYAPSLRSLEYIQDAAKDFVVHNFSSLTESHIFFKSFSKQQTREEKSYHANNLLRRLSNVKLLYLSGNLFKALSFADDHLSNLPTFHNLIDLEVTSKFPCSKYKTLLDFLQISPNLEYLVFDEGFKECLSDDEDCWSPYLVPQCLLLHLKLVEFQEFYGHHGELKAVQFFLKNARILRRMTIVSSSDLSTTLKNKFMKQLLMFPRGSTSCVVDFS